MQSINTVKTLLNMLKIVFNYRSEIQCIVNNFIDYI